MSIKLHQAHDSFTRRMLSDIQVARAIIKKHVPIGIVKRVDWESLQLSNKSFVTEELKQYHSDIVYKCTIDNREAYVYTLVEQQSTPDELLPFRILEYNVLLMRQHLDEGNKKLPIIINICIYAGKESPYPYSLDIFDCFEEVELAKEYIFKAVQLVDLTILAPEELLKEGASGLVEILLKQGKERDHLNWINSNPILICRLIDSPFGLSSIIYILGTDDKNRPKELLEAIIKASPNNKEVIMSAAHKLQEEARLEGIKEGIKEGKQEGMQQTKLVIAKNMVKKGCEVSFIREITGLSADAIKKLEQE